MRDHLVFYVNGNRHTVGGDEALLTLSDYLRGSGPASGSGGAGSALGGERLCGTKIACAEGDCGACTVLVGKPSESGDHFRYETIDACIAFLFQLDQRHIVTVEGLSDGDRLSPVQQAMVDCHGSQCGFCTPGFVMALQGLVEEGASCALGGCPDDSPPDDGFPGDGSLDDGSLDDGSLDDGSLDDDAMRLGLSGNLCRCTGYSQILDAGR
ncbi:MAG: 2Fe-2S iron-sulfur cluster-binding protein, partial [Planctomycetota bacterium]